MAKFKALGTQLQMATVGAPTVFTTVAQIRTISGPGGDTDEIDVTTHDSAAGFKETLAGFKDPGEISIEGILDASAATHDGTTGLAARYTDGATVNWKMILPDTGSSTLTFPGWVKNFTIDSSFDDALKFSATIRVAGAITFPA